MSIHKPYQRTIQNPIHTMTQESIVGELKKQEIRLLDAEYRFSKLQAQYLLAQVSMLESEISLRQNLVEQINDKLTTLYSVQHELNNKIKMLQ